MKARVLVEQRIFLIGLKRRKREAIRGGKTIGPYKSSTSKRLADREASVFISKGEGPQRDLPDAGKRKKKNKKQARGCEKV